MAIMRLGLAVWMCVCGSGMVAAAATNVIVAQNSPFTSRVWKPEAGGLPQVSVVAVTQGRDGYLWLGTLNGLVRFDGIHFRVFHPANTPGLNDRGIVSLLEDSRGRLWIATETAGVSFVEDGELRSFDPWRDGLARRMVSMVEDSAGSVWMLTADGQLCRFHEGQQRVMRFDNPNAPPRRLFVEDTSLLWIVTDVGMISYQIAAVRGEMMGPPAHVWSAPGRFKFAFAGRSGEHWRLANSRVQKWKGNLLKRDFGPFPWGTNEVRVTAACEDAQGNPVIGTLGDGVYWMDANGGAVHLTKGNNGLSYDWILALHMDREENLWVGTDGGGLNRVRRHPFGVLKDTAGLVIQSVSADASGTLWMGVNFGDVRCWQEGRLDWFRIKLPEVVAVNLPVRTVFASGSPEVWAGVEVGAGLCRLEHGQFVPCPGPPEIRQSVTTIFKDPRGVLWFGTQNGLVRSNGRDWRVFTTRDGLSANNVSALASDAEGNLWIGTRGGGLNRMREDRFTTFRAPGASKADDDIAALLVDTNGVVWVGSSGGLGRLESGQWTRYSVKEGLPSYSVGYLIEDGLGHLWLGSYVGLIRVSKQQLNEVAAGKPASIVWRTFGSSDGLPVGECTQASQPAAHRDTDGRLWFPTVSGLIFVDPSQIKPNPHPPPVVIESVVVDGEPQATSILGTLTTNQVVVPPRSESVVISYTSLSLAAPERTRFRYLLEAHETGWSEVTERSTRYPRLPPGRYRFHVQACNEDGVWSEAGARLEITVLPPFWQTWWFLTATSLLLLGALAGIVRTVSTRKLQRQVERMEQQEALEKERHRIARDLHDQLGASLTQVSLLGELVEGDRNLPEEVELHGKQISQTARETTHVLDEIVWAVNPSNDTLEGLVNYVCKYAQDYLAVAGVRYRLEVPAQLPAIGIPPDVRHNVFLASKEAITNVVRHARAEAAWIRLKLEPRRFQLEIEDNGCGLKLLDDKKGRNGLRNMRKRIEDVGGEFQIAPGAEGGTQVRFTVPLDKR